MRIISSLLSALFICVLAIIILLVVFTPAKCEHVNMATKYSFVSYYETAHSSVRPYCRDCGELFQFQLFDGTPTDQSYLSAFEGHIDNSAIIPGEYYTVTATVTQKFHFEYEDAWLKCRLENADYIVGFSAEFREEFRETVGSIEDGEEITFRGRFYDEGCGFTDCELISIK